MIRMMQLVSGKVDGYDRKNAAKAIQNPQIESSQIDSTLSNDRAAANAVEAAAPTSGLREKMRKPSLSFAKILESMKLAGTKSKESEAGADTDKYSSNKYSNSQKSQKSQATKNAQKNSQKGPLNFFLQEAEPELDFSALESMHAAREVVELVIVNGKGIRDFIKTCDLQFAQGLSWFPPQLVGKMVETVMLDTLLKKTLETDASPVSQLISTDHIWKKVAVVAGKFCARMWVLIWASNNENKNNDVGDIDEVKEQTARCIHQLLSTFGRQLVPIFSSLFLVPEFRRVGDLINFVRSLYAETADGNLSLLIINDMGFSLKFKF
jgi:hypothetical protein